MKDKDGNEIEVPETTKQVLEEIKTIGATSKENHDKMNENYKKLEEEFKKTGDVDRLKITKLQEDILTRQGEIDKANKAVTERIDQLEAAMKRPGGIISKASEADVKSAKEAFDFHMACKASRGEKLSAVERRTYKPDVKELTDYKAQLPEYLRSGKEILGAEELKALSVGVDPDGGYTVTPEMSTRIISRIFESDPIRQLATVETISTDAIEFPVDWGEFSAGWVGETQTRAKTTNAQMKKKRITVHELYAYPEATQQLIEDSAINIESWIARKVAEKFSRLEAASFVTGDGINKPRGFLTYDNGTDYGQIEQVNMGAASAITADGYVKLKYSLKEFFLGRGIFLMNRQTVRDSMLLKDGTGNYIWKPALAVDSPSTILSLPVRMSTTMPTVATGSLSVALADWSETYTIVDRLGITVIRDNLTNKPLIGFYTRKRVGGDVVNYEAIKIGKIAL